MAANNVARAFGRAARSYDEYAGVQLAVARSLLDMIPPDIQAQQALDLGCGTAPMAQQLCARLPACRWLGVDLSADMLEEANDRGRLHSRYQPLCADGSSLPLDDASQDLIFSSFALQWLPEQQVCREIYRLLRPGGWLVAALPVAGTLRELKESWAAADDAVHVNPLAAAPQWLQALTDSGLPCVDTQVVTLMEHYPSLTAVARMLKMTGAHHVSGRQQAGLMSPRRRRALEQAYEMKRVEKGLPLTWQVLFVTVQKPL